MRSYLNVYSSYTILVRSLTVRLLFVVFPRTLLLVTHPAPEFDETCAAVASSTDRINPPRPCCTRFPIDSLCRSLHAWIDFAGGPVIVRIRQRIVSEVPEARRRLHE